MTKQKTGFGSRRGFLARLAAMGTVLGGVVPELRAYGMTGSTPWTPPNMGSTPGMGGSTAMPTNPSMAPTTPNYQSAVPILSPSAAALLYASALTDPDVRVLLAHVERDATIMPVQSSADLGSGGQIIKLPVRGPTGVTTAVIMYGRATVINQSSQHIPVTIRMLLKSDGTSMVANHGRAVPTTEDAAEAVQVLYRMTFPTEALERRLAAGANGLRSRRSRDTPNQENQDSRLQRRTYYSCATEYHVCMRGSIDPRNNVYMMIAAVALILIVGITMIPMTAAAAAAGVAAGTTATAVGAIVGLKTGTYVIAYHLFAMIPFSMATVNHLVAESNDEHCHQEYQKCMAKAEH